MQPSPTIVGILSPGEMGSTLGKILRQAGCRVVTTLAGRGTSTRAACAAAGLEVLDTLTDVVRIAEVVLSVVPPVAARAVAEAFAASARRAGPAPLYVDLNAIAPATARAVACIVKGAGGDFVDGAVHGLACRLPEHGTVYLSGPLAPRAAALLGKALRVRVLGNEPGTASAFKMLVAGINKGVVALFLEVSLAARRAGLLDDLLACCRDSYPGVLDIVTRTLPTYPRHVARRADELAELEEMVRGLGMRPCLVPGARELLQEMGQLPLAKGLRATWTVADVIEECHAAGLLGLIPEGQALKEKLRSGWEL